MKILLRCRYYETGKQHVYHNNRLINENEYMHVHEAYNRNTKNLVAFETAPMEHFMEIILFS